MRDPARIHEFCAELERVWSLVPDWRFGQLVVNILGVDPFYIEDDKSLFLLGACLADKKNAETEETE